MNFIKAFENKIILIPLLQRDYVQGNVESIITPFIEQLVDKDRHSDLNYIYGYNEDGKFVPIDGQQRLITLWLLHLYCAAKSHNALNIKLQFMSREFANDFCEHLDSNLSILLGKLKEQDEEDLGHAIINESWFISSWKFNETVRGMLNALKYIHRECKCKDVSELWKQLNSDNCHIVFSFLDMGGEQGLDDDIYIKMNGRGRPLSVFENLKSWMDEQVTTSKQSTSNMEEEKEWRNLWPTYMDNKWTDFFWENRNVGQEHPEEIDDEQLYCFCNLLILYWMRHKDKLKDKLEAIKKDETLFEDFLRLLKKEGKKEDVEHIVSYFFERLQKAALPPLVWIERLELMPTEFLRFAFDALNTLHDLSDKINKSETHIGSIKEGQTKTYYLSMCVGTFERTLPLFYAILLCNDTKKLHNWFRVCRNLIENTKIEQEKLPTILECLERFYTYVKDKDLLKVLAEDENIDTLLNKFRTSQVKEERQKAELPQEFRTAIEKLENHPFFFGRIGILFKVLGNSNDIVAGGLNKLEKCTAVLSTIFSKKKATGVREKFDKEDEYLLRRALMAVSKPNYYGYCKGNDWCFCNNREEWKAFLDTQTDGLNTFKQLINNCIERLDSNNHDVEKTCKDYMKEIIAETESDYERKLNEQDRENKFSLHFVHHPGVWKYMQNKKCHWGDNDFKIMLKRRDRVNKMNLRTYALYLDYCNRSIREGLVEDRKDWKCFCYEREDSCFYFEKYFSSIRRTIAIDVLHNGSKEDDYSLNLFVRPTNEESAKGPSVLQATNEQYLSDIISKIQDFQVRICEESGRYTTVEHYSRDGIICAIRTLITTINATIEGKANETK